jgi:hypothetical protein
MRAPLIQLPSDWDAHKDMAFCQKSYVSAVPDRGQMWADVKQAWDDLTRVVDSALNVLLPACYPAESTASVPLLQPDKKVQLLKARLSKRHDIHAVRLAERCSEMLLCYTQMPYKDFTDPNSIWGRQLLELAAAIRRLAWELDDFMARAEPKYNRAVSPALRALFRDPAADELSQSPTEPIQ